LIFLCIKFSTKKHYKQSLFKRILITNLVRMPKYFFTKPTGFYPTKKQTLITVVLLHALVLFGLATHEFNRKSMPNLPDFPEIEVTISEKTPEKIIEIIKIPKIIDKKLTPSQVVKPSPPKVDQAKREPIIKPIKPIPSPEVKEVAPVPPTPIPPIIPTPKIEPITKATPEVQPKDEQAHKVAPEGLPKPEPMQKTSVPSSEPFAPKTPPPTPQPVAREAATIAAPTPGPEEKPVIVAAKIDARGACQTPSYPSESLQLEEEGTVRIGFLIGADGKINDSRIEKSSGFKRLDDAAKDALSLCKYSPRTENGVPVSSWLRLNYVWKLKR